jgi:signal transduction histidine kinase
VSPVTIALGIAVVVLLVANAALVILFRRHTRRLAKLRMNFIAGVSHELRTPLAVISSAAENLADGVVERPEAVREYGELIKREGLRLGALVERILLFSSVKDTPRRQPHVVEVGPVVEETLGGAASSIQSGGFTLEKSIDPELPRALADEEGIKRCLQNLIGNALKYGGESRWIGVRAMVSTESTGPEIQVIVSDRGMGIEPGDLPHVFEPFYRGLRAQAAQAYGTGLGLSLTKDIVQSMGGTISVESEVGKGSAFTLHLPIAWP